MTPASGEPAGPESLPGQGEPAGPGEPPTLRTARLELRPFAPTDARRVSELAGDRAIADTTLSIPHPYDEAMAGEWIRSLPGRLDRGNRTWAIVHPPDGLVGSVELRVEPEHDRAELGYWVGVPYQGRGYASEAAAAVCDYAFDRLGLRRVYAHHVARNPASGRVLSRIGMEREGVLRQHLVSRGRVEDLVLWGRVSDGAS